MDYNINNITTIGFDLDHTLARYHLPAFKVLLHELATKLLVEKLGSSAKSLLVTYYGDYFGCKGLLYDKTKGNLIKVDSRGKVRYCLHGNFNRNQKEIQIQYPLPLDLINSHENFFHFQTYYDTALLSLFVNWTILVDDQPHMFHYNELFLHMGDILEELYGDFHTSPFYKEIKRSPETYLMSRPLLKEWFLRKDQAMYTFLLSNSPYEYVDFVCNYLLGNAWQLFFEFVITDSNKPSFFTKETPFVNLCNNEAIDISSCLPLGIHKHGNVKQLINSLHHFPPMGNKILFLDDSLNSVIATKQNTNWLCGLVMEELLDKPTCEIFGTYSGQDNHWLDSSLEHGDMFIDCLETLPELLSKKQAIIVRM